MLEVALGELELEELELEELELEEGEELEIVEDPKNIREARPRPAPAWT